MPREELSVLAAFAVVADERSFTRAAVRLGVSTSAISHSIRALGPGGACPHCDEPLLVAELLGKEVLL